MDKKGVRCFYKLLFLGVLLMLFIGCSKSIHVSRGRLFRVTKNRDRVPTFLFKRKVERYFDKWYAESCALEKADTTEHDSLTRLAYAIYETLMSDSLNTPSGYKYLIVPTTIQVTTLSRAGLDSCYNSYGFYEKSDSQYTTITIANFYPQLKNRKSLFFTPKYQKRFYKFSARYGVKPYVLIDSPLMHGGDRYMETSPYVSEIKIYKNTPIISIVYSAGTSDFESFFEYSSNRLTFIKDRYELAVD